VEAKHAMLSIVQGVSGSCNKLRKSVCREQWLPSWHEMRNTSLTRNTGMQLKCSASGHRVMMTVHLYLVWQLLHLYARAILRLDIATVKLNCSLSDQT